MKLSILADEGLNGKIVQKLREKRFSVDWVQEISSGAPDLEVIKLAKRYNQILITEDKDFGEWVFAHNIKGLSIIFLRYEKEDYPQIIEYLLTLLEDLTKSSSHSMNEFITINKNKVRRRKI